MNKKNFIDFFILRKIKLVEILIYFSELVQVRKLNFRIFGITGQPGLDF